MQYMDQSGIKDQRAEGLLMDTFSIGNFLPISPGYHKLGLSPVYCDPINNQTWK
jgi:hypothetical protein